MCSNIREPLVTGMGCLKLDENGSLYSEGFGRTTSTPWDRLDTFRASFIVRDPFVGFSFGCGRSLPSLGRGSKLHRNESSLWMMKQAQKTQGLSLPGGVQALGHYTMGTNVDKVMTGSARFDPNADGTSPRKDSAHVREISSSTGRMWAVFESTQKN